MDTKNDAEKQHTNEDAVTPREFAEALNMLAGAGRVAELVQAYAKAGIGERERVGQAILEASRVRAKGKKALGCDDIEVIMEAGLPGEIKGGLFGAFNLMLCDEAETAAKDGELSFFARWFGYKDSIVGEFGERFEGTLKRAIGEKAVSGDANIYFLCEVWDSDVARDTKESVVPAVTAAMEKGYRSHASYHGYVQVLSHKSLPNELKERALEIITEDKWLDKLDQTVAKGEEFPEGTVLRIAKCLLDNGYCEGPASMVGRESIPDKAKAEIIGHLGKRGFAALLAQMRGSVGRRHKAGVERALGEAVEPGREGGIKIESAGMDGLNSLVDAAKPESGLPVGTREAIVDALAENFKKQPYDSMIFVEFAIANCLGREDFPERVRAVVEAGVIKGLDGCENKDPDYHHTFMLRDMLHKKESMPARVREAFERAYKRNFALPIAKEKIGRYLEERKKVGKRNEAGAMRKLFGRLVKPKGADAGGKLKR